MENKRRRARTAVARAARSVGRFLGELKRRRVFRVVVGYAAAAWLALEVTATIGPALGFGDASVRWVAGAAVLLFPAVLVLAWLFDITRQGIRRTEPAVSSAVGQGSTGAGAAARRQEASSGAGGPHAIVVLPLVDRSPDGGHRYLGEGITEELINALARVRGLRVVSRTTAFALGGERADVRDIARRLGVRSVLEGSVRVTERRLRLAAQLVSADDGLSIWSRTFDRQLDDVFAIQEEVAQAVVEALRGELLERGQRVPSLPAGDSLVRLSTDDVEAYALYLRGRALWNERTPPSIREAIAYFERAAARDPGFAHAHAGIADGWSMLLEYGLVSPGQGLPLARTAAERALRLDAEVPESRTAAAIVRQQEWDWVGAEAEFRAALRRNPGYVVARQRRALQLAWLGRPEAAREEIERARGLDPLSPLVATSAGWIEHYAGRSAAALRIGRDVLRENADFVNARMLVALASLVSGEADRAVVELERVSVATPDSAVTLALLALALGRAGREADCREALLRLREREQSGYVPPYYKALALLGAADHEGALAALEAAAEEGSPHLAYLAVDPLLAPLRGLPSFAAVVGRAGLTAAFATAGPAGSNQ